MYMDIHICIWQIYIYIYTYLLHYLITIVREWTNRIIDITSEYRKNICKKYIKIYRPSFYHNLIYNPFTKPTTASFQQRRYFQINANLLHAFFLIWAPTHLKRNEFGNWNQSEVPYFVLLPHKSLNWYSSNPKNLVFPSWCSKFHNWTGTTGEWVSTENAPHQISATVHNSQLSSSGSRFMGKIETSQPN